MNLEQELNEITGRMFGKNIAACSTPLLYNALMVLAKERMSAHPVIKGDRKLYYISMEFLIGKLLSNNLINLGLYDEVKEVLKENGHTLSEIEEHEPEPSLGNGGLGRLRHAFSIP